MVLVALLLASPVSPNQLGIEFNKKFGVSSQKVKELILTK